MCSASFLRRQGRCHDDDTGELTAEIDYGPISKTVLAKPWSDPTAIRSHDFKAAQRLVSGACGFSADFVCMGKDAGDAFEANAKVLESYNKVHIQPGVLTAEFAQYGVVLLGTWRGIPLYVSEEQYEDRRRHDEIFRPAEGSAVAASGVQSTMAYGGRRASLEDGKRHAGLRRPARAAVYWDPSGEDYRRLRLSAVRSRFPATPQPGPSCRCWLNQFQSYGKSNLRTPSESRRLDGSL